MTPDIRALDPSDAGALRAWWEVGAAATRDRPGHAWPAWEVSRIALPAVNPERDTTLVAAYDGDVMVGSAIFLLPTQENLHTCGFDVYVVPERRREGIGTALVADLEARARSAERTTLLVDAYIPPGETGPAGAFGERLGYAVASRETIKVLDLATYSERRASLREEIGDRGDAYRIVTWDTVCPDEHLESFGRLLGTALSQIPLGDLDLQDSDWSPDRLRAAERRWVDIGRRVYTAAAIAPDGTVAGSSDARVDLADPRHGGIGLTVVDPEHRGHRLGLLLKIATHDMLVAAHPDCREIDTCNAEVNIHMNAVNELLGYRTVETLLEMQKVL